MTNQLGNLTFCSAILVHVYLYTNVCTCTYVHTEREVSELAGHFVISRGVTIPLSRGRGSRQLHASSLFGQKLKLLSVAVGGPVLYISIKDYHQSVLVAVMCKMHSKLHS